MLSASSEADSRFATTIHENISVAENEGGFYLDVSTAYNFNTLQEFNCSASEASGINCNIIFLIKKERDCGGKG